MVSGELLGVDVVVRGLAQLDVRARYAAYAGVVQALQIAEKASRDIISLGDHSLKDLAKMGHPYAVRDPHNPHSPGESVHTQRGDYLRALTVTRPQGNVQGIVEGKVSIEGDMKERDRWIQQGTKKMIARPWMAYVVRENREAMRDAILAAVEAATRGVA